MNPGEHMIREWVSGFVRDCKARDLSGHTVEYYRSQLAYFVAYCNNIGVNYPLQITPDVLRSYLLRLDETGHNPGGKHAKYRAVRVFLRWWEDEVAPPDWVNPINRVKPPKVSIEPIEPVSLDDVQALVSDCDSSFVGRRDAAMIYFMLDTGVRLAELLALNLEDVELIGGDILIRSGKGGKPRTVFLGKKSRKALRTYLLLRIDGDPALWVTEQGSRVARRTVQGMLVRRAERVGVPPPSPHDFRRAFAIEMLRNGVDIYSIKRLMGHSTLEMLSRYLAQTVEDLEIAHQKGGPVDRI